MTGCAILDGNIAARKNGKRLPCESLQAENAKLRELAKEACKMARAFYNLGGTFNDLDDLLCEAAELGVEVDDG